MLPAHFYVLQNVTQGPGGFPACALRACSNQSQVLRLRSARFLAFPVAAILCQQHVGELTVELSAATGRVVAAGNLGGFEQEHQTLPAHVHTVSTLGEALRWVLSLRRPALLVGLQLSAKRSKTLICRLLRPKHVITLE